MQIEHPGKTDGLKDLWREAFGDGDAFIDGFFETAYSPRRCRCIRDGEETAAMLFWLDGACRGRKMAYLYAVATAKKFRGLGLCRTLMEDTCNLLKAQGCAAAMLYPAGEGLRKMYRKMGFQDCGRSLEFSCEAGGTTKIRRISGEEYGKRRRELLPEDGVIQEGENLAFLAKCAELYAGPDFLLAASREGDTLRAAEFLGNREAAPAAVRALGCRQGTFRQGADAMLLPLVENVDFPGYLGLVFD